MTKRFSPVTSDQIESLRMQLTTGGMTVPDGNSGVICDAAQGVSLQFDYDGTSLLLQILTKPWYVTASEIWDAIGEYLPA